MVLEEALGSFNSCILLEDAVEGGAVDGAAVVVEEEEDVE